ncbi:MAG TPA: hypothetical protein VM821_03890 [Abditibacteriaceae bacterium]|nr:hypothetical protein [Abditibacteriaceae bacterium]
MKLFRFAVFVLCAAAVCSMSKVRAEPAATQLQNATRVQPAAQGQSAMMQLRNIKPNVVATAGDKLH